MTHESDTTAEFLAEDGLPHSDPRIAYIGVDGERYRVLAPVQSIWIRRAEGANDELGEWTFPSWHEAEDHLDAASRTAPKDGSYHKHDYQVTWVDGATCSGRHDLTFGHRSDRLQSQVRHFLTWLRDDEEHTPEIMRKGASTMLLSHDMGQPPVPAPDHWKVVHDYRQGPRNLAEIQARYFSHSK